ncbi:MAG: DUF4391 domain-containing protein [Oscillospiraceae bacterium]|nr:DUF4391 domain-containing protein [Oscillospiraceae bacterium]
MLDLIQIPDKYKLHMKQERYDELKNRIFADGEIGSYVEQLAWIASIKPCLGDTIPVHSGNARYEELQVFHVVINNYQELYAIFDALYKAIRYQCLLIIQYKDRYIISACRFSPGKVNYDANVNRAKVFSHWIFPDNLSTGASKLIERINNAIANEGDLQIMYNSIFDAVRDFSIGGVSRPHVVRLVTHMIGGKKVEDSFWEKCTPYKLHYLDGNGKAAQYKQRTKQFKYVFDTEDLWHAFLSDEKIKATINARRYRDIDELIQTIDERYDRLGGEW